MTLTEPRAWRLIAKRLADPKHTMLHGLCHEVDKLWCDEKITAHTKHIMQTRIEAHLRYPFLYAYLPGESREARLLAALWLELDALHNPYS